MIEEKQFSSKRMTNIGIMLVMTMVLSVALGVFYNFMIDQIISIIFLSILYFALFVLCLVHSRTHGMIAKNFTSTYEQIRNIYCILCICVFLLSFLPEFTAPILIIGIVLSMTTNSLIGLTIGVYFNVILCMTVHNDFYELSAYILLSLVGCIFAEMLKDEKNRILLFVIILCISIILPCIFNFLAAFSFHKELIYYGFAGGLLSDLLIFLFFDKINKYTSKVNERSLLDITRDDYPLVLEIQKYSRLDYEHAIKVSQLCEKCAPLIQTDPLLLRAAGFYYRIGKIQGEQPFVENGVLMVQNDCFPAEVIQIVAEYNGEIKLPSTPASALVHIVDTLVKKFEIMDKNTLSSAWNYEIIITQTLNEASTTGLYDESGLTMNQFLKIREFFVKGERLF